ncbi:MAG: glycosyltransferase family 2 protein [Chloroflexota bacterium]|nr:glycosyltransferase family 2 protein [Chloroflexota bacterium]
MVGVPATAPSITAFFPCYNDAGTIATIVITADRTLRELTQDYEIIVGNDGSTDNSAEILAELQTIYPRLRVLLHENNLGYGGNLRSMFAAATKDLIFYTDGDAQYDPAELRLLYEQLGPDVDVVQGWKIARSDPLHRKIIGRIYHHFVRFWFGLHLRDVDCDFRLFRRGVLESFPLESNSGCITVEMMTRIEQAGFRVVEVPVHHYHRAYGESQFFNFPRVARTLYELTLLWLKLKVLPRRQTSVSATPPRMMRSA